VKLKAVAALFKLRLTSLVVFSAALGYLTGVPAGAVDGAALAILCIAGLMVTGASNALNQVLEVEQDSLMKRTAERPLVRGVMAPGETILLALLSAAVGILLLWSTFGPLTAILGFLSLFMYVALYTPMKKHTPWAVFVGAFPGAFPPMLGYVAATGHFGLGPGLVFAIQFLWQFPHFWSIAWVLNDDYLRAGYRLLPSPGGRDRSSAFLILLYALFTLPMGMLPWYFGMAGVVSMVVAILAGGLMVWPALRLMITHDVMDARRLMFASFLYLPMVQLACAFDRP
jgi:protoheme IX farnesyltransferase